MGAATGTSENGNPRTRSKSVTSGTCKPRSEERRGSLALDEPGGHSHLASMSTRIVIDPEVCSGRPIVAGTRVRVVDVLNGLAAGDTIEEIVADFPYITREDVLACIAYGARAVDHSVVQAAA